MRKELTNIPKPLYQIHYLGKRKSPGLIYRPVIKMIRLQTEKQYNDWLKTSYAIAKNQYDVLIEKYNTETKQYEEVII